MVARALDYETVKEYIITVEARDGGTPSLSSSAVVKVLVVDANDNRPVFARNNYTAVVREDVAVNTSLLQVCQSVRGTSLHLLLLLLLLDGMALYLCLEAFRTSPASSISIMASEPPH